MHYKSIEEIKKANLAGWEKKVMIKQFKFEQNVHEAAKYALKQTGAYKDLKGEYKMKNENLEKIAKTVVEFVNGFVIDSGDVGATDFYDDCKTTLIFDYPELSGKEIGEVLKIIREKYLGE